MVENVGFVHGRNAIFVQLTLVARAIMPRGFEDGNSLVTGQYLLVLMDSRLSVSVIDLMC